MSHPPGEDSRSTYESPDISVLLETVTLAELHLLTNRFWLVQEIGMRRKIQVLPTMEAWRGGECLDSVGSGEPAKVLELLDRHFDESKQEAEGAEGGGSAQLAKAAIAAGALCALGGFFLVFPRPITRKRVPLTPLTLHSTALLHQIPPVCSLPWVVSIM